MACGGHPDKKDAQEPSTDNQDKKVAQELPIDNQYVAAKNRRADTSVPWTRKQVEEMAKSPSFQDLSNHAKLLLAYAYEDFPLHVRRTLDQSYYHTLQDAEIRKHDLDQVLFRYTHKDLGNGVASRLLMVDQLWLWIIDEPDHTSKTYLNSDTQFSDTNLIV
jgi:hypothetical protein